MSTHITRFVMPVMQKFNFYRYFLIAATQLNSSAAMHLVFNFCFDITSAYQKGPTLRLTGMFNNSATATMVRHIYVLLQADVYLTAAY